MMDGSPSELDNVVSGVPQGGVLGPLLLLCGVRDAWPLDGG